MFYIESLEAALNDTKLTKDREIEQLQMKISDEEGYYYSISNDSI